MLFLAFIAALMGSPSWLAFWCVLSLLTGHKKPLLLALPLFAGLMGEPGWGAISILVIWAATATKSDRVGDTAGTSPIYSP